jgi:hypothetical protein
MCVRERLKRLALMERIPLAQAMIVWFSSDMGCPNSDSPLFCLEEWRLTISW